MEDLVLVQPVIQRGRGDDRVIRDAKLTCDWSVVNVHSRRHSQPPPTEGPAPRTGVASQDRDPAAPRIAGWGPTLSWCSTSTCSTLTRSQPRSRIKRTTSISGLSTHGRTGQVAFWTTDTGIDGENPVELDELEGLDGGAVIIESSVWFGSPSR